MADWSQRRPETDTARGARTRQSERDSEDRGAERCGNFRPDFNVILGDNNFCCKKMCHPGVTHKNRRGECWREGDEKAWRPGQRQGTGQSESGGDFEGDDGEEYNGD